VKRDRLAAFGDRVRPEALRQQLRQAGERLAAFPERLAHAMRRTLEREQQHIPALEGRLESHRQAVRNRPAGGYCPVWGPGGRGGGLRRCGSAGCSARPTVPRRKGRSGRRGAAQAEAEINARFPAGGAAVRRYWQPAVPLLALATLALPASADDAITLRGAL